MAFCTKCGAQMDEDAKFCAVCGKPVGDAEPAAPAEPEVSAAEATAAPEESASTPPPAPEESVPEAPDVAETPAVPEAGTPGSPPPVVPAAAPAKGGSGSSGGKKALIFSLVGVVVLALVVVLVGGLVWPGWFKSDDSPKKVTEDFFNHLKNGKFEKAYDLLSRDERKSMTLKELKEDGSIYKGFTVKAVSEKIKGDSATVTCEISFMGYKQKQDLQLVKEDGKWKVEFSSTGYDYDDDDNDDYDYDYDDDDFDFDYDDFDFDDLNYEDLLDYDFDF